MAAANAGTTINEFINRAISKELENELATRSLDTYEDDERDWLFSKRVSIILANVFLQYPLLR